VVILFKKEDLIMTVSPTVFIGLAYQQLVSKASSIDMAINKTSTELRNLKDLKAIRLCGVLAFIIALIGTILVAKGVIPIDNLDGFTQMAIGIDVILLMVIWVFHNRIQKMKNLKPSEPKMSQAISDLTLQWKRMWLEISTSNSEDAVLFILANQESFKKIEKLINDLITFNSRFSINIPQKLKEDLTGIRDDIQSCRDQSEARGNQKIKFDAARQVRGLYSI
jgi:hypothetical protein